MPAVCGMCVIRVLQVGKFVHVFMTFLKSCLEECNKFPVGCASGKVQLPNVVFACRRQSPIFLMSDV